MRSLAGWRPSRDAAFTRRARRLAAAALLFLVPAIAWAQAGGNVVGRVTESAAGTGVTGVSVVVEGTSLGALTGPDGKFRIVNVPVGSRTIIARRIGFTAQRTTVTVLPGADVTALLVLTSSPIALDQVVVTGTAGAQERRSIGNSISQISASDELSKSAAPNLSSLLTARAAGVAIRQRGGRLGAGPSIEIRGRNSLSLENSPLIYIDGVRVNNSMSAGPASVSGRLGGQGAAVGGRLNDIDPNDIESIEVIKGPAASTIYGTEAANGVIQIITKRGAVGAKPQMTFSMELGTMEFANAERRVQSNHAKQASSGNIIVWNGLTQEADSGRPIYRTGQTRRYSGSVSGSRDVFRYYLGAGYENSFGIEPNNSIRRFSLHSNLDVQLRPRTTLSTSLNYVTAMNHLGADFGASPLLGAQVGHSLLFAGTRGFFAVVPEVPQQLYDNSDDINRFTASATLSNQAASWFTQRLIAGIDYTGEDARALERFAPPAIAKYMTVTAAGGSIGQTLRHFTVVSADYSGTANFKLASQWTSRSSLGGQFYHTSNNASFLAGTIFPAPGVEIVSGATTPVASSQSQVINTTIGAFGEQQFGWRERVYLTAGVRVDNNSAFGDQFKWVTYPKVSGSWVIHEEPFFKWRDYVNALRLRVAYGESGRQPAAFAALRTFAAATGPGGSSAVTPASLGNPDLRPERGKELELGFEAGVLNRLTLDFTYFTKRTLDQIVSQPVAPSSGFPGSQFRNLGRVDNSGVELSATLRALTWRRATWDITGNVSSNRDIIKSLGGLPTLIAAAGSWNRVGYPIGSWFSKRVVSADRDPNTQMATNVLCDGGPGQAPVACASAPFVYIGTPTPRSFGAIGNTVTLFEKWRLYGLVDFRRGNRTYNAIEQLRCTGALGAGLCRETYYPAEFPPVRLAETIPTAGAQGIIDQYIQDASFVKLRELSVSYTLPETWVASRTSLTLSARNLKTWTKYRGLDPEANVNNAGATAVAQDQASTPPLRSLTATINIAW